MCSGLDFPEFGLEVGLDGPALEIGVDVPGEVDELILSSVSAEKCGSQVLAWLGQRFITRSISDMVGSAPLTRSPRLFWVVERLVPGFPLELITGSAVFSKFCMEGVHTAGGCLPYSSFARSFASRGKCRVIAS